MRGPRPVCRLIVPLASLAGLVLFGAWVGGRGSSALAQTIPEGGIPLAPYVVTPPDVVDRMLELAEVRKGDLVFDLGSGDGRIVITAARKYGARGMGFDIDPQMVQRGRDNAGRAGVSGLVQFQLQDVLTVDLSPASVVTLYLLPDLNLMLRPRLLSQLRPGARVVSHDFHMGDWIPDRVERIRDGSGEFHTLYLWRIRSQRPKQ